MWENRRVQIAGPLRLFWLRPALSWEYLAIVLRITTGWELLVPESDLLQPSRVKSRFDHLSPSAARRFDRSGGLMETGLIARRNARRTDASWPRSPKSQQSFASNRTRNVT